MTPKQFLKTQDRIRELAKRSAECQGSIKQLEQSIESEYGISDRGEGLFSQIIQELADCRRRLRANEAKSKRLTESFVRKYGDLLENR